MVIIIGEKARSPAVLRADHEDHRNLENRRDRVLVAGKQRHAHGRLRGDRRRFGSTDPLIGAWIEILDLERIDRRVQHLSHERLLEIRLILHRQAALRRVVVAVDIEADAHVCRERRVERRRRERDLVTDRGCRRNGRGIARDPAASTSRGQRCADAARQATRPTAALNLNRAGVDPCLEHLTEGGGAFGIERRVANDPTVRDDGRERARPRRGHHARDGEPDDELHERHAASSPHRRVTRRGVRYIYVLSS
jgi:hypothetical protein